MLRQLSRMENHHDHKQTTCKWSQTTKIENKKTTNPYLCLASAGGEEGGRGRGRGGQVGARGGAVAGAARADLLQRHVLGRVHDAGPGARGRH